MEKNEEKFLIEKIQGGDKEAFGKIFDFYYDKIFRFAYRRTSFPEAAKDITSIVFSDIIINIKKFKWKKDNSFRSWIYRIANNKICDYFRKNYRQKTIELKRADNLKETIPNNPLDKLILEEERDIINKAIASLPNKDQEIINLIFFEEMTSKEIAEILGCSVNSVYVRLHRTLKKLKSLIKL